MNAVQLRAVPDDSPALTWSLSTQLAQGSTNDSHVTDRSHFGAIWLWLHSSAQLPPSPIAAPTLHQAAHKFSWAPNLQEHF